MGLQSIPYGKHPKILLLGNGINRAYGSNSWDDILGGISCGTYSEKEINMLKKLPYPMQAVVASADCVDKGVEIFAEDLCKNEVNEIQKDILRLLIENRYDTVLTTNYSYEIECALDDNFLCKYKQKSSYRKTSYKGTNVDEQFGLFKYMEVNHNDVMIPIWHIHGEAARPKSIILGHYYYGKLLSRLQCYVSNVISRYEGCNRYKKDFIPQSWLDYFLIGDVDIIGLGLDASEMDLWWLINCKKINSEKLGRCTVNWYEPNLDSDSAFAKKVLAKTYGVNVKTEIVGNGEFEKYYRRLVERYRLENESE